MVRVPKRLHDLLREVLLKHQPSMVPLLSSGGELSLNPDQREPLRRSLGKELCESGLMPDDEPNARGLALEELIDLVGNA